VRTLREFRRVLVPGGQVLVVGPNNPQETVLQRVADAIMLFYDAEEADRMFTTAGFEAIEHRLLSNRSVTPTAIMTDARAPE
jgi:demethylmenaquinone methyltransferase/2-methoxy-6-polyprenyl-1,4-benzoquinol methylase